MIYFEIRFSDPDGKNTLIQLSVAESRKRMGRLSPSQYIIGIGDNFYFHGVENDEDEMFEKVCRFRSF